MEEKKYISLERLQEYDNLLKEDIDSKMNSKSDVSHNHDDAYDAKGAAAQALVDAKTYTDEFAGTDAPLKVGDAAYSVKQLADEGEENVAQSKYSMALGRKSITGQRAYYIAAICWDKCQILLSTSSERDLNTRPYIYSGIDLISFADTSKDIGFAAPTFEYIPLNSSNFNKYFVADSYWGGGSKTFNDDGSCDITFTRDNMPLSGREVPGITCTSLLQASETNKFGISFTVEATFKGNGGGHAGVSEGSNGWFYDSERVYDGDTCIKDINTGYFIGAYLYTDTETDAVSVTLKNFRLITGIEDGPKVDYISIIQPEDHLNRKRYITNVTGNVITFNSRFGAANEFNADSVDRWWNSDDLGIDDYTVYCPDKPDVGAATITTTSYATGYHCAATGSYSSAEGVYCISEGSYSHAEGQSTRAGYAAHSEGAGTIASGKYAHTEGFYTTGEGLGAHAEGYKTIVRGDYAHAEGSGSVAGAAYTHAEGFNTEASGLQAHAEGTGTKATGINSHAEGNTTTASGNNSHAEGSNTSATRGYAHAEGYNTLAEAQSAHAEGENSKAYGAYSHAEGSGTKVGGAAAAGHAEGCSTAAEGLYSHAEGESTIASGARSHSEGKTTTASGAVSHAEGFETTASGTKSHAEGLNTTASGEGAHAEGSWTTSEAYATHAEGDGSHATALAAHAEGSATTAKGQASHAEGNGNTATGAFSHVGGSWSEAKGENSFVHGLSASTRGDNSFALGEGIVTYENVANQFDIGKYNAYRSDSLFEVGNGTSNSRSNAFAVLNNGRAVFGSGSFGYVAPDTLEENALFFVLEEPNTITFRIKYITSACIYNYSYNVSKGTTWKDYIDSLSGKNTYTETSVCVYMSDNIIGGIVTHNSVNVLPTDVIHHECVYIVSE